MLAHLVRADVLMKNEKATIAYQRQDNKKEESKVKPDNQQKPNKPDIAEVPKARKQTRPPVVVKPNIKVKPIKVIRPNIKRP